MSRAAYLVFATICFAILCGLGVWQVQRLAQKNALIAAIDQRIAATPQPLADVLAKQTRGDDVEYTSVTASGAFLDTPDLRKIGAFNGSAGYELIAPFLTTDNTVILVDRGAIPMEASPDQIRAASKQAQTITGILRAHNKGQGTFDGENNETTNQWVWWDIPAMLGVVPIPPDAKVSNLILQLLPDEATQPPIAAAPKAELRNNHMGYAVTWFGLAASLLGVSAVFLRRKG
jgi:surfeit locus 1 family protein